MKHREDSARPIFAGSGPATCGGGVTAAFGTELQNGSWGVLSRPGAFAKERLAIRKVVQGADDPFRRETITVRVGHAD
jgi:hypothetical protein